MKREPRLLAPVLATPDDASVAEFSRLPEAVYTTTVFLDGFVAPPEAAVPVSFDLEYRGDGGREHLVQQDIWTVKVNATVSGAEAGFIPVPAEYRVLAGGIRF